MGGGNAMKSATAKKRNAEKNKNSNKGSTRAVDAAAKNVTCSVCRQQFMCTVRKPELEQHVTAKHDGKAGFEKCFPAYV